MHSCFFPDHVASCSCPIIVLFERCRCRQSCLKQIESILSFTPDDVIEKLFRHLAALVVTQVDVLDTAELHKGGKDLGLTTKEPDNLPPEEKEDFWNPTKRSKCWDPQWVQGAWVMPLCVSHVPDCVFEGKENWD